MSNWASLEKVSVSLPDIDRDSPLLFTFDSYMS